MKYSLNMLTTNVKVSHRSQPSMAFDLSVGQLAGSGCLHGLVRSSWILDSSDLPVLSAAQGPIEHGDILNGGGLRDM